MKSHNEKSYKGKIPNEIPKLRTLDLPKPSQTKPLFPDLCSMCPTPAASCQDHSKPIIEDF